MALVSKSSEVASANLQSGSDSVSGLEPYVDSTIVINVTTSYTPYVSASTNCVANSVTTSGSSTNSQTTLTITFASSSAGTFSVTLYQGYGGRTLSVTGVVQSGTYSDNPKASMSMGGDVEGRSINLELGNSATTQIDLGGAEARGLAEVSSGTIDIEDFYGKEASFGPFNVAITYSSINSYTDTNIPANTSGSNNTQITGTALWRRLRLTTTSSGTFYLYIRGQRDGTATYYYGDAQVAAYVVDADGSNETINTLDTPTGIMTGWKTYNAGSGSTWDTNSSNWAEAITSGSNGRFTFRSTNSVTGSSSTGRLYNVAANYDGASNLGYGYFETSGSNPVSNAYYHARSPSFTLSSGQHLDVYYGVDCQAWQSIKFSIGT